MSLKYSDLEPYQRRYFNEAIGKATTGFNEDQVGILLNELNILNRTGNYSSGRGNKEVSAALEKLPQNKQELNKFIVENTKDLGSLTPEEFGARISSLQSLNQPSKPSSGPNLEGLKNYIEGQINLEKTRRYKPEDRNSPARYSVLGDTDIKALSDQLARAIFANPNMDISQVISDPLYAGELSSSFEKGKAAYKEELKGIPPAAQDNSLETTQKAFEDYKNKIVSENEAQNFINSLPAELSRNREQFIGQLQQQAGREFTQRVAPDIAQTLNARGLLNSGDLPSELARGAASTFNPVQQAALDLQAQDDQFFQNAGYQNALRQEIEAGRRVTNQTAGMNQTSLVNQQMNFERTQAGLRRQFEEGQFERSQQRAYIQEQQRLQNQQNAQRTQRQNDLAYGIAGNVANIAGSYAGAKLAGGTAGVSPVTTG